MEAGSSLFDLLIAVSDGDTPFRPAMRDAVASSTDSFVSHVGDVLATAHAYIARWRARRDTATMTPACLTMSEFIAQRELRRFAHYFPYYGVKPNGSSFPIRLRQEEYPNVPDKHVLTTSEFRGDVAKGGCSYPRWIHHDKPQARWSQN